MQQSAICLTVRNEKNDIAEWVAHHASIGVGRLIIYDDNSSDGTLERLRELADHFPIDVISWKTEESNRQVAAYADCLARYRAEYEWIGFLDADEFLIPPRGELLPQLLERHRDNEAFSLNWLMFGNADVEDTNGRLVMESFTRRAESQFHINRHVKSFVRPSAVKTITNPHYFEGPEAYVDVMGQPIAWEGPGVVKDGTFVMGDWRLHHYFVRSKAHFKRRLTRGRANDGPARTQALFDSHNRNEVADETALPYAERVAGMLQGMGFRGTAGSIQFHIDEIGNDGIRGWARDVAADQGATVVLRLVIDGKEQVQFACDQFRDDLQREGVKSHAGYQFSLPRAYLDGNDHALTVQTLDGRNVVIRRDEEHVAETVFNAKWSPKFVSNLEGFDGDVLKGWVMRVGDDGKLVGNETLTITCNGVAIGNARANRNRGDVGRTHASDPNCGFEFVIPAEHRATSPQRFAVRVEPFGVELNGGPVTHSFWNASQEEKLMALREASDDLFRRAASLRRMFREILSTRHHSVGDYKAWSLKYFDGLHRRVELEHQQAGHRTAPHPKISIVCPVYKPNIADFVQAVESVINQTHKDWELILVDDGSKMPELTAQIKAFTSRDARIKAFARRANGGIASATNRALKAARGQWVVFFDHDDLLVDVALEVMLKQTKTSNALLFYSDEDKIDGNGQLRQPHFKGGWNYRMMLSANYICHLVMVNRAVLTKAGNLSTKYDGAQDHELLLRLSEHIAADRIKHVPEILYHWRMSASSTAGSVEAKPYAVEAGRQAVRDHLQRRGLQADVESVAGMTWYKVNWSFAKEPKVCIIIPFKDQVDMTRECFERVIGGTKYKNFEVILVDNWSIKDETREFCKKAAEHPNVRVMRIEEPFNFSRLNNEAARQTDADYLVLMNNDLHIHDELWLRTMVNEAMADKDVGIVGGKFLYPNGSVQHAGVVTGVGGVACHTHGGIGENDHGYAGRAVLAQEMSAVTAACLLVEAKLYREVRGLDEQHLKVAFNDVDLCLKARQLGRKVIWTPAFMATHHESISRGLDDNSAKESRFFDEMCFMQEKWGDVLTNDPFYSPFFDIDHLVPFDVLVSPDTYPTRSHAPVLAGPGKWNHA